MKTLCDRLREAAETDNRMLFTLAAESIERHQAWLKEERRKYARLAEQLQRVTESWNGDIDRLAELKNELSELQTCPNCGLQYTGWHAEKITADRENDI